jgi:hypothetical protein
MTKLPLLKRLRVWWIVICETRKLAVMATEPVREMQAYAQSAAVPEKIREIIPATLVDLAAGRKPYESVHLILSAMIERSVPEFTRAESSRHLYGDARVLKANG